MARSGSPSCTASPTPPKPQRRSPSARANRRHSASTLIRPGPVGAGHHNRGCVQRVGFRSSRWARRDHDRSDPEPRRRTERAVPARIGLHHCAFGGGLPSVVGNRPTELLVCPLDDHGLVVVGLDDDRPARGAGHVRQVHGLEVRSAEQSDSAAAPDRADAGGDGDERVVRVPVPYNSDVPRTRGRTYTTGGRNHPSKTRRRSPRRTP